MGPSWFESCLAAERDGDLVGFLGAAVDRELGRAWIHGPLVLPAVCDELADRLPERCAADVAARGAPDHEPRSEDRELTGYAAGRIDARGEGCSRRLVTSICRRLLHAAPVPGVAPTVYEDDVAALAVYDRSASSPR